VGAMIGLPCDKEVSVLENSYGATLRPNGHLHWIEGAALTEVEQETIEGLRRRVVHGAVGSVQCFARIGALPALLK
jgi:hypothetical protein